MVWYGSSDSFASLGAVASIGVQNLQGEHSAFLADGAGGDIDPADSE